MDAPENDISSSQESEQRDELLRLQQELADLEQWISEHELVPSADHIVVQLESLKQKIDTNSALYYEVQTQLDELHMSANKEQQPTGENMQTTQLTLEKGGGTNEESDGGLQKVPGGFSQLEQQAAATKQTIATAYEHTITETRWANNRLPQDWFSQKILQPTLGKLLQRMSTYVKNSGW